jgi:hypothetical protein
LATREGKRKEANKRISTIDQKPKERKRAISLEEKSWSP